MIKSDGLDARGYHLTYGRPRWAQGRRWTARSGGGRCRRGRGPGRRRAAAAPGNRCTGRRSWTPCLTAALCAAPSLMTARWTPSMVQLPAARVLLIWPPGCMLHCDMRRMAHDVPPVSCLSDRMYRAASKSGSLQPTSAMQHYGQDVAYQARAGSNPRCFSSACEHDKLCPKPALRCHHAELPDDLAECVISRFAEANFARINNKASCVVHRPNFAA